MRAFFEIFRLEFIGFVRSRALALLSIASVAWMFLVPFLFHADGTDEGAREICIRFSLGGVTALLAVALLVAATGALARERAAKRLQLTMVRPVPILAIVIAKITALSLAGSLILALAASVESVRQDAARKCYSVYRPILPSPEEEAATMYESYMTDPETPPAVKKARKSVVMRLLVQRALDHYQTIPTNETAVWNFQLPNPKSTLSMRFRFTNMYNMRDDVIGCVQTQNAWGGVSNITQAVVTIPLDGQPREPSPCQCRPGEVGFHNQGLRPVMLRPRRDVELLVAADDFRANLLRAYIQLVGVLTLLVAFGVFLGAGLSRPVAVFVAVVTLALGEMSPSVIESYPDELEVDRIDALGLSLARFSAAVTHPIGSVTPLTALAMDDRVESRDVARTLLTDILILPLFLALASALILPRKQDEL